MSKFLKPLENVDGFSLKENLSSEYAPCPLCKGYGGWNLRLDAYGPGQHFKAFCSQCVGWGYVREGSLDVTCIHEDEEVSRPVNNRSGWHETRCKKCGRKSGYDTSD